MRSLPSFRALLAFEAAARHLSVAKAADELCVTPSAVSHQIASLEETLGIRLFHRTNRTLSLTDVGRHYLSFLGDTFNRVEQTTAHLVHQGISDILTVHCPPSFAPSWLLPRLPDFSARYPDIDIRIHATPEPPDFFRSHTDVEIRYGNGEWSELVVEKIVVEPVTPLISPTLRKDLPVHPKARDLFGFPLIHSERAMISWTDWFRSQNEERVLSQRGFWFDRGYLSIQAAVQGMGIALESLVFAERELNEGRLVRVFEEEAASLLSGAHYLVYPPDFDSLPKVRRFREWMLEQRKKP